MTSMHDMSAPPEHDGSKQSDSIGRTRQGSAPHVRKKRKLEGGRGKAGEGRKWRTAIATAKTIKGMTNTTAKVITGVARTTVKAIGWARGYMIQIPGWLGGNNMWE